MDSIYYKKYLKYKTKFVKLKEKVTTQKYKNVTFYERNKELIEEDKRKKVLFYFGHFGDNKMVNYKLLNKNFDGCLVYFIDEENKWYNNKFVNIKEYIDLNYRDIDHYIFMGYSMGGYAAINLALHYPGKSICIALSPQTINLSKKILLSNNLDWYDEDKGTTFKKPLIENPPIETDITDLLNDERLVDGEGKRTNIYIINSKYECDSYISVITKNIIQQDSVYLDNLHAGILLNYSNVKLILFNDNNHSVASSIDLNKLNKFINDSHLELYDIEKGSQLLLAQLEKFVRPEAEEAAAGAEEAATGAEEAAAGAGAEEAATGAGGD